MKAKAIASLENKIEEWFTDQSDSGDLPDGLAHPNLIPQMAIAAAQVFQACYESQEYAQKENA